MNDYKKVARFYLPIVKKQLLYYPLASVVISLIIVWLLSLSNQPTLFTIAFAGIVSYMWYFAPLVLSRVKSPEIMTMLPASGNAKALVPIVYFMIGIPLMLYIPMVTTLWIADLFRPDWFVAPIKLIGTQYQSPFDMLISGMSNTFIVSICLYTVICSRRKVALNGFLSIILSLFAIGFISGTIGFLMALNEVTAIKTSTQPVDPDQMLAMLQSPIHSFIILFGLISLAATIVMLFMTGHKIKNRQL